MMTSAMQNSLTLVRNAEEMPGKVSLNSLPLKNDCLTSSQPADLTTATTIAAKKTTVLARAIATARPPPPVLSPPRILEPRSPSSVCLLQQRRAARLGEPILLEPLEGPVRPHRRQRLVHAADE
jgi:hypothetical protein